MPVHGRSWRCDAHKRAAVRRSIEAHRLRNHDEILARQRQALRRLRVEEPARYAHRLATKKAWRARNAVRIKIQKRKWRLNPDRPNGYSSREKYEAYHRAYRATHAAHRRALAKRRYYELHPERPHPLCACGCGRPIPWDGRGRPAKWLSTHAPWPRALTPEESLMKGVERAIAVLERTAAQVRKKLAGAEALQMELAAIEQAMITLRATATGAPDGTSVQPARRGRARVAAT